MGHISWWISNDDWINERCEGMWKEKLAAIFTGLSDVEMKLIVENSSSLGRRWLSTIPYYQPLRLTDFEISTGINYRLLSPSPNTSCSWCGSSNNLGHDEVCRTRPLRTVARHDSVVRVLYAALRTVDPTAEYEPHSFEGRRRNDLRMRGSSRLGHSQLDFDVKVYSLLSSHSHRAGARRPNNLTPLQHATGNVRWARRCLQG